MPKGKRRGKKRGKKGRKQGKRSGGFLMAGERKYTTVVNPMFGPFKPRMAVSFKYNDVISIAIGAGIIGQYTYRMNSIFKPDKNNPGHQPFYFDSLSPIYNRYCVWRFRYRVRVPNTTGDLILVMASFNGLSPTINTLAGFNTACEYFGRVIRTTGGGANEVIFTKSIYLPMLNGVSAQVYGSDDRFQSLVTTNPTELFEFNIVYYNPTVAATTAQFEVLLTYDCELYDMITQGESFRQHLYSLEDKKLSSLDSNVDEVKPSPAFADVPIDRLSTSMERLSLISPLTQSFVAKRVDAKIESAMSAMYGSKIRSSPSSHDVSRRQIPDERLL